MKLNKYQIISIATIVVGMPIFYLQETVGSVIVTGGVIALIVFSVQKKKQAQETTTKQVQQHTYSRPASIRKTMPEGITLDGTSYELRYSYDNIGYSSAIELPVGTFFSVKVSDGAIVFYDDESERGTVIGSTHTEMINDYCRRGEPVLIMPIGKDSALLGFYKKALTRAELESHAHVTCALTHNSSKDYQDCIECTSEGSSEQIEVDYDDDMNTVYNVGELGRLPKSGTEFIDDNGGNVRNFIAFVDSIEENDSGKLNVTVTVYKK